MAEHQCEVYLPILLERIDRGFMESVADTETVMDDQCLLCRCCSKKASGPMFISQQRELVGRGK